MSHVSNNRGIVTLGGTTHVTGSAIGDGAAVNVGRPEPQRSATSPTHDSYDIGIVSILAVETRALVDVLGLEEDPGHAGPRRFYVGTVEAPDRAVRVVATQALRPGQRAVIPTLGALHEHYDPDMVVLVGIGGAIHPDVSLDDVVVATRVVYYDLRKETAEGVRRRGEEREAPAAVVHGVNAFFAAHGDPAEMHMTSSAGAETGFRAFHGPIGSGDAVIADRASGIRRFLAAYNDKVLAVDMESGGLSQFCHESSSGSGHPLGWLVIRGISDHADQAKDDDRHNSASVHAAHAVRCLVPFIRDGGLGRRPG